MSPRRYTTMQKHADNYVLGTWASHVHSSRPHAPPSLMVRFMTFLSHSTIWEDWASYHLPTYHPFFDLSDSFPLFMLQLEGVPYPVTSVLCEYTTIYYLFHY